LSDGRGFLRVVVAAVALLASGLAVPAGAPARVADFEFHCMHPEHLSPYSAGHSVLDVLRKACPLLSHVVEEFALRDLGEATIREGTSPHDGEMAAIAVLALSGDSASANQRAELALASKTSRYELREILYITVLNGGIAQAIEMTRALAELLIDTEADEQAGALVDASEG
jgi:alkylhydroperoxidase/carboxymuconolactone decarboxylase family protein YurZ